MSSARLKNTQGVSDQPDSDEPATLDRADGRVTATIKGTSRTLYPVTQVGKILKFRTDRDHIRALTDDGAVIWQELVKIALGKRAGNAQAALTYMADRLYGKTPDTILSLSADLGDTPTSELAADALEALIRQLKSTPTVDALPPGPDQNQETSTQGVKDKENAETAVIVAVPSLFSSVIPAEPLDIAPLSTQVTQSGEAPEPTEPPRRKRGRPPGRSRGG